MSTDDILANLGAHRAKSQAPVTEAKRRAGRTARSRGNAYERDIAHRLDAERVGQYGGKPDVVSEWLVIQAKIGGVFPERPWRWLQELPAKADQLRAVVIGDAPGPGHPRREVIVLDLQDFIDWFGPVEDTPLVNRRDT